jgi:hypothetical protein
MVEEGRGRGGEGEGDGGGGEGEREVRGGNRRLDERPPLPLSPSLPLPSPSLFLSSLVERPPAPLPRLPSLPDRPHLTPMSLPPQVTSRPLSSFASPPLSLNPKHGLSCVDKKHVSISVVLKPTPTPNTPRIQCASKGVGRTVKSTTTHTPSFPPYACRQRRCISTARPACYACSWWHSFTRFPNTPPTPHPPPCRHRRCMSTARFSLLPSYLQRCLLHPVPPCLPPPS